jgi:hypothetical protein
MMRDRADATAASDDGQPKGPTSIACLLFVVVLGGAFWAGALWAAQPWLR